MTQPATQRLVGPRLESDAQREAFFHSAMGRARAAARRFCRSGRSSAYFDQALSDLLWGLFQGYEKWDPSHKPTMDRADFCWRIANNRLLDGLRRWRRHLLVPLETAPTAQVGDHRATAQLEARITVLDLMRKSAGLRQRDRRVLRMRYWHNLRNAEIAKHLGVSEGRVSQIHKRAIGALRATARVV